MATAHPHHRGVSLGLLVVLILDQGIAHGLARKLTFTSPGCDASSPPEAMNGDLNDTDVEMKPCCRVDLQSDMCLGKISIKNNKDTDDLEGARVWAGLSDDHNNTLCGTRVTSDQTLSNDWIDSVCNPPLLARYVSVYIPRMAALTRCEVAVSTCDQLQAKDNRMDITLVTHLVALGQTGDNDAIIEAYKGPHDITADIACDRKEETGGGNKLFPGSKIEVADPQTGHKVTVLSSTDEGGMNGMGVLYCEATKNDSNLMIQIVILPKDESKVQVSPVQRTLTASVGDSVTLQMRAVNSPNRNYTWRHNGSEVIESWNDRLEVSIPNVTKEHEGIYSCFASGQENLQLHGIMRLIVRDCPSGMWGSPDSPNICRRCYNGGVCDDKTGTCICAPGFSGENCGQVHGRHVFGRDASLSCSNSTDPHNDACRGHLFCLPDPYGCSCAAGYKGLGCMQECENGTYGADCKQTCHCAPGVTCSKDTGECIGGKQKCHCPPGVACKDPGECDGSCKSPYFGSNCQCSTESGVLGLEVKPSSDPRQLYVTWKLDSCAENYALQHTLTNTDRCDDVALPQQMASASPFFFTGLEAGSNYTVSIRPSYNGKLGPDVSYPRTIRPSEPPSYVKLTSAVPRSLVFSWSKPPCRGRGGIITGYSCRLNGTNETFSIDTSNESAVFYNLTPSTEYSFEVAARTAVGTGPYSEDLVERTPEEVVERTLVEATGNGRAVAKTTVRTEPKREASVERAPEEGNGIGNEEAEGAWAVFPVLIIAIFVFAVVYRRRTSQVRKTSSVGEDILPGVINKNFEPDEELATSPNANETEEVNVQMPQPELPPRPTQPVAQLSQEEECLQQSNTASPHANETGEEVNAQIPPPEPPPRPTHPVADLLQEEECLQHLNTTIPHGTEEVNAQMPPPELPLRSTQPVAELSQEEECLQQSNTESPHGNGTEEEVNTQIPPPEPPPRPTQPAAQSSQDDGGYLRPFRLPPPVQVNLLADHIRVKKLGGNYGFEAEYKILPDGLLHPRTVANKPENKNKNQYEKVVAYDHSRIVLQPLESDPHSDYINACYVDGYMASDKYIASQGPNEATVADMWRMVWQMNVDRIVTLANPVENGKPKYQHYWPDSGSTVYSDIMVTLVKQAVHLDYTVRVFKIQQAVSAEGCRLVKQFHYTTWPDMTPPERPTPLLNFIRVVNTNQNEGRAIIHCSTGIGRTGTYIALDAMLEQMKQEGQMNVPGFIYRLRKKRTSMVDTLEQYKFIFDALWAASVTGDTTYHTSDLSQQVTALKTMTSGSSKTGIMRQYKALSKLRVRRGSKSAEPPSGKLPENVHKNRFQDFVPTDQSRVRLKTKAHEDDNDYINATYLPGYRRTDAYIGAQMPMPNTVADIWRMVYDQKSTCIVMLNPLDINDETMCQYWPDDESIEFGPLVVELLETKEYDGVIGRKLSLRNKDEESEEVRTVSLFQCLDWPSDEKVPSSLQGMQTLVELTLQNQRELHPIVVHCVDGLRRTPIFCAVMTLVEQFKEERVVDVFQVALRLQSINRCMIHCVEHYAMCYDVLQRYLDSTVEANFNDKSVNANV